MKGIPLFLFSLLFLTILIAGCQDESILPSADSATALHGHDDDDYLAGTSIGDCLQRSTGTCCGGRVGNLVWYDANCDGYQDYTGREREHGIEGVEVRLLDAVTGELLGVTYTDSLGHYKFRHLCDGDYIVEIVVPEGYALTQPYAVPDTTSDSNPNPSLVLIRNENIDKSIDFGLCEHIGEGCTPGYWKQEQHFDSWPAPYTPDMLFSDVFEDAFPGLTLVEVLDLGDGGLNALGRHTVAAMLNGASDGVNYLYTDEEVIDMFNDLYPAGKADYEALKDMFEYNNELGCPLN